VEALREGGVKTGREEPVAETGVEFADGEIIKVESR